MIDDTQEKQLLVEEPETPEQDTVQELPEAAQAEPAEEPTPQQVSQKNDSERNLAALRAKAEKAERERDELLAYLRAQQQPQTTQHQEPEPEEEINYNDEDLVEGKHLKKERQRYQKELNSIKEELKQYKQHTYQYTLETRLRTEYPDIENVLTTENVHAFREANPNLATALAYAPDPYIQAVETYKQIKALGLVPEPEVQADKQRALKNMAKPKPTASISPQGSDSPLSRANAFAEGLTSERKAQLWKEMQEKARGAY